MLYRVVFEHRIELVDKHRLIDFGTRAGTRD